VSREPIDVLVVSSWFPAYDDPAAGRFVADQAEALLTTGIVRPFAISFDGIRLSGGGTARGRQEAVSTAVIRAAAGTVDPLFATSVPHLDPALPVARLAVVEGQTPSTQALHGLRHREVALRDVAARLAAAGAGRGVVHAHTVYPDGAAASVLAEALGWPLVITEHSSFVERLLATDDLRDAYGSAVAAASRVFAVSTMLANELKIAFPALADRFHVLPNAVPVDLFRPAPLEERSPDELLFVGYRKPSKGIENLLRAVAFARSTRPTITLRLLGRSPDAATEAAWHDLAATLGISPAVAFEEPVDRRGIADAMATASLFVHPSPRETFGVVAVEALASGTPVVATDSGGVTEIMGPEPSRYGAIVPIDDPTALGEAIVETLERRSRFDPAQLRASVERRFSTPYVAERLLVEYREVLGATAGGGGSIVAPGPMSVGSAPVVVLALDRARAASRLGPLPAGLRATMTLISCREPAEITLPTVGRLVEVDVEAPWHPKPEGPAATRRPGWSGRFARLANDPLGTIERRLGRGPGSEAALKPAVKAVRAVMAADARATVLPIDGHDHLVVSAAAASSRLAAGGSLRRLADAWGSAVDVVAD
jgi:glycosyltransferase involved in cell wall biosynthesis